MAVTYCTTAQVASFLQVDAFSVSTSPTDTEVAEFINRAEQYIDEKTHHAWRSTTVTSRLLDVYEQYDDVSVAGYICSAHLPHGRITNPLTSLKVYDGSTFVEWISSKTEGYNDDYWIDYDRGIIYFRNTYPYRKENAIIVSYAYGAGAVPKDIEKAAILLAAADVLAGDDYTHLIPEGSYSTRMTNKSKIEAWRSEAEKIIAQRSELVTV